MVDTESQTGADQSNASLTEPGLLLNQVTELKAKVIILETELATEKEAHLATMQINESLLVKIEEFELAPKASSKLLPGNVTKIPDSSFEIDKIDYVITVPAFYLDGSRVTAEQLLADTAMQARLVKDGIGFIKRKGDK